MVRDSSWVVGCRFCLEAGWGLCEVKGRIKHKRGRGAVRMHVHGVGVGNDEDPI